MAFHVRKNRQEAADPARDHLREVIESGIDHVVSSFEKNPIVWKSKEGSRSSAFVNQLHDFMVRNLEGAVEVEYGIPAFRLGDEHWLIRTPDARHPNRLSQPPGARLLALCGLPEPSRLPLFPEVPSILRPQWFLLMPRLVYQGLSQVVQQVPYKMAKLLGGIDPRGRFEPEWIEDGIVQIGHQSQELMPRYNEAAPALKIDVDMHSVPSESDKE